jgi:hypothetical protein
MPTIPRRGGQTSSERMAPVVDKRVIPLYTWPTYRLDRNHDINN